MVGGEQQTPPPLLQSNRVFKRHTLFGRVVDFPEKGTSTTSVCIESTLTLYLLGVPAIIFG